jgi:hypothetical protein
MGVGWGAGPGGVCRQAGVGGGVSGEEPAAANWRAALVEAAAQFGAQMEHIGHVLHAQGAMGWMYRGDLERARTALGNLPVDALRQVSVASAALSHLADEVATKDAGP